jgi:hypothetical protein
LSLGVPPKSRLPESLVVVLRSRFYEKGRDLSRNSLTMVMSSILCKKQRGDLLAFRIQVIEHGIENSFHALVIPKHAHRSSPSFYHAKSPLDKIRSADLEPQAHLSFLPTQLIEPLLLLCRQLNLVERQQINRFIPACAGNAYFSVVHLDSPTVNPRVCGERSYIFLTLTASIPRNCSMLLFSGGFSLNESSLCDLGGKDRVLPLTPYLPVLPFFR